MSARNRAGVAAVAGAATLAILGGGVALADPPFKPQRTDIVGVGSDTTQSVMNAYAKAYNATKPARRLASFNATGSANIVTKAGCAPIARPNGSSAGIAALRADTKGCIDFARSSRPKATDGSENSLAFFAYARDGVTWVTVPSAKTPANLTTNDLRNIYTCAVTNWHSVSRQLPSNPIHAYLPQVGSGTRSFFESAIGITDSQVGSCVKQSIEENTGTQLKHDTLAIAPYSIAKWIAQKKKKETDVRGGVTLHRINGTNPLTASGKLNTRFSSGFLRLVYNVVKTTGGTVPAAYLNIFGPSGFICTHQSIAVSYGFARLGGACGSRS